MQKKISIKPEIQLKQKEQELYSIQKIGQALSNTLNLDKLLNLIMKEITKLMDADRSTLYLVDRSRQEIWSKIALKAEIKEIRQKIGVGISGYVAETGEVINIPDAYSDSRFDPSTDKKTGYRTRSILCMPVWEPASEEKSRQLLGVIQVLNKRTGPFSESDEGILAAIASEVAVAISNARLYQQLENKYKEIDLLYEYEQKLSGQYDIREIFKEMLSSLLQHLDLEQAGIIYPLGNKFHYLHLTNQNKLDHQIFEGKDQNFLELLGGKGHTDEVDKQMVDILGTDYAYKRLIQLNFEAESEPFALLLLNKSLDFYEAEDFQMVDIIEQKISRALELNMLRERLLNQERLSAIGQMMSTIVHDLRGPISNVNGFLDLLTDADVTPEEHQEFTQIMSLELQSITNMTTEILDFAKGKTSILPRKSGAADVLRRAQPQFEQLFRHSNIELEIQNTAKKKCNVDIEKFNRVLYNIAKNAKEAMQNKGHFKVNCYDEGRQVVFELTDDGPGIPDEIKDRLFESFVTSGKQSGTGLGLAIVRKIIDEHKGTIDLESTPRKGTTFYIKLPEYEVES